jgi:hypothetical protein
LANCVNKAGSGVGGGISAGVGLFFGCSWGWK